MPESVYACIFT